MTANTVAVDIATTERLVREALELHRLALTASEIRHLPSPATARERNAKGAADPTAGTALDERRAAVATALDNVSGQAHAMLADVRNSATALRTALDRWDSRK